MRVDVRGANILLDTPIWMPGAAPSGPVYAPVISAERIAPVSLTFGRGNERGSANSASSASIGADSGDSGNRFAPVPLGFIAEGPLMVSAPGNLVSGPVATPTVGALRISTSVSASVPDLPLTAPRIAAATRAPRGSSRLIDIPQIIAARRIAPPSGTTPRAALVSGSGTDSSAAAANRSVEAAFAGAIDVSGAVRASLPIAPRQREQPSGVGPQEIAGFATRPRPREAAAASREEQLELVSRTQLGARINGVLTGNVDFRQLDGSIAVRLSSVVELLRDRYTSETFDRMSRSAASNAFVSIAQLQAAGIQINYDPAYDELSFGIDYNDAANAGKVQVEQIGMPSMGSSRALIDQIPR
jgi:hypothetical protein